MYTPKTQTEVNFDHNEVVQHDYGVYYAQNRLLWVRPPLCEPKCSNSRPGGRGLSTSGFRQSAPVQKMSHRAQADMFFPKHRTPGP